MLLLEADALPINDSNILHNSKKGFPTATPDVQHVLVNSIIFWGEEVKWWGEMQLKYFTLKCAKTLFLPLPSDAKYLSPEGFSHISAQALC